MFRIVRYSSDQKSYKYILANGFVPTGLPYCCSFLVFKRAHYHLCRYVLTLVSHERRIRTRKTVNCIRISLRQIWKTTFCWNSENCFQINGDVRGFARRIRNAEDRRGKKKLKIRRYKCVPDTQYITTVERKRIYIYSGDKGSLDETDKKWGKHAHAPKTETPSAAPGRFSPRFLRGIESIKDRKYY